VTSAIKLNAQASESDARVSKWDSLKLILYAGHHETGSPIPIVIKPLTSHLIN
jgi:hypothetical protein